MKILRSSRTAQAHCRQARRPLVLVPTMGALHDGHLALVGRARELAGPKGTVAVSIFVNPTQFGPKEDFARYPRPRQADKALCEQAGVDLIFLPSPADMYREGYSTYVDELSLSQGLCGKSRPGHFRGVCTVVAKLFNILSPDSAVFGRKDYQQLAIIQQMTRDLNFPVKIQPVDTLREPDGLAMSSRNRYLSPEERAQAPVIRKALLAAKRSGLRTAQGLRNTVLKTLKEADLSRVDYIEVVDPQTLAPLSPRQKSTRPILIAAAVFFGKTRLIDNILLR